MAQDPTKDAPPDDEGSELDPEILEEYEREAYARYEEARAWIVEKWHGGDPENAQRHPKECPMCSSNLWTIGDVLDVPMRELSSRVFSYFPVSCTNCGYTVFVNANIASIGEVSPLEDAEPEPEAKP